MADSIPDEAATSQPPPKPFINPLGPFDASRLKIARARRHLAEFSTELSAYMINGAIKLVVDIPIGYPPHLKNHAWMFKIREPLPEHLSAIVGDVIHNLRSALDLMACDLVRLAGQSANGVYFPFSERENDLNMMIKRRNFDRAGPEVVKMLKALKPYKGGNTALRAIHDLDIIDKHQMLVPVASAGASPAAKINFGGPADTDVPSITSRIAHHNQILVMMPPVSNLPLGTEIPLTVQFVFGEEAKELAGRNMLEAMHQFLNLTDSIVASFRGHFTPEGGEAGD